MSTDLSETPGAADDENIRRLLRRSLLARRQALAETEVVRLSAAICARLATEFPELARAAVAFCWPVKNEPDLRPLMGEWHQAGARIALPVVVGADEPLAFRSWQPGQALREDRYGIPTPEAGDFLLPEVVIAPVLAFDANGYRLGYGGGFFDRTLAELAPRPLAIGVGFGFQQVESIRPQPHDKRLDAVVTEEGSLRFTDIWD
ncbi:MAG: 5-formyltetrahydrofolate cyclo-ligase [Betaproteobacteria bacterium]|nr:5-formyltetrahydrofolate cyclo-ligase [Betaproteobacteria bacterium]